MRQHARFIFKMTIYQSIAHQHEEAFAFLTVTHKQNDHLIPLVNKVRTS